MCGIHFLIADSYIQKQVQSCGHEVRAIFWPSILEHVFQRTEQTLEFFIIVTVPAKTKNDIVNDAAVAEEERWR